MPAETHMEGAPIERDEVLDLVRERLADILEIDPAGIAEGAAFADDLGAFCVTHIASDSLDVVTDVDHVCRHGALWSVWVALSSFGTLCFAWHVELLLFVFGFGT